MTGGSAGGAQARPTVALLGTGAMGAGMARSVARAGLPLRVWNRTPERARPLADVATVAASPAAAVEGADVVVTMLFDADAVLAAVEPTGLGAGQLWLQTSTVGVEGADRLAGWAAERGVTHVDAPVLGTKGPAEQGALTVLAAGPESARAAATPVFDAIGSRTLWVGEAGAASRLKLALNAWVLTTVQGVAESLALAGALGVDPRLVLQALDGSATNSPYVQMKGAAMLDGALDPMFPLVGAVKDARLIAQAAAEAGLDLHVVPALREAFARAAAEGHGGLDMAATYLSVRPG